MKHAKLLSIYLSIYLSIFVANAFCSQQPQLLLKNKTFYSTEFVNYIQKQYNLLDGTIKKRLLDPGQFYLIKPEKIEFDSLIKADVIHSGKKFGTVILNNDQISEFIPEKNCLEYFKSIGGTEESILSFQEVEGLYKRYLEKKIISKDDFDIYMQELCEHFEINFDQYKQENSIYWQETGTTGSNENGFKSDTFDTDNQVTIDINVQLMRSIRFGEDINVIEELLKNCADSNFLECRTITSPERYSDEGDVIKQKTEIHSLETPLLRAMSYKDIDSALQLIDLLVSYGAYPVLDDAYLLLQTALFKSVGGKFQANGFVPEKDPRLFKKVLDLGVSVDTLDNQGKTLLENMESIQSKTNFHIACIEILQGNYENSVDPIDELSQVNDQSSAKNFIVSNSWFIGGSLAVTIIALLIAHKAGIFSKYFGFHEIDDLMQDVEE